VFGKLVTARPLTKPAKSAGDQIILIGKTGSDGNDTLYRAGLVGEMKPAIARFKVERAVMEASLGAAVCESARYGGFGAQVDLANVPLWEKSLTPEEIMICETQARMVVQVAKKDVEAVLKAVRAKKVRAEVIGQIHRDDKQVFEYKGKTVAEIPQAQLNELVSG